VNVIRIVQSARSGELLFASDIALVNVDMTIEMLFRNILYHIGEEIKT
jgi:hypothetical protein